MIVREDGVIVTSYHVIARDKSTQLYDEIYFALPVDGRLAIQSSDLYRLKPVALNKSLDLALLKVADETGGSRDRDACD